MQKLFLIIFIFSSKSYSQTFVDKFYQAAGAMYSNETCPAQSTNSLPCQNKTMAEKNRNDLQKTSETVFSNDLAKLDMARTQCVQAEWNSYSDPKNSKSAQNKKLIIDQMNQVIPTLMNINKQISLLVYKNSELEPKIPKTEGFQLSAKEKAQIQAKREPMLNEYNERQQQVTALVALYKMVQNQIPHGDDPVMNKFLLEHMGGYMQKGFVPVTEADFQKVSADINGELDAALDEVESTKKNGNYELSSSQKNRMALDPTLSAQWISKNPSQLASFQSFQCHVKLRDEGKKGLVKTATTVVTVASLALPLAGAIAAKAAEAAFVLESPALLSTVSVAARSLGLASVALGGISMAHQVANNCKPENGTTISGSCEKDAKMLTEQFSLSSCLVNVTLAALPASLRGSLKILKKLSPKEIEDLAAEVKSVAKIRDQSKRQAIIDKVSVLDDDSRFELGKKLLGEDRVKELGPEKLKALIDKVHAIPTTSETLPEKVALLAEGGLTPAEREIFMRGSVTGMPTKGSKLKTMEEVVAGLDASPNKSRLLGDMEGAKAKPDIKVMSDHFKNSMDGYAADIARKAKPSANDLDSLSYTAARYGSVATDAKEVARAETLVGTSFEQSLTYIPASQQAEYVQQYLWELQASTGSKIQNASQNFKANAIKKYLNAKKGWNLR